ncbi:Cell wall-associated hydrolase, NlpC family [Seinonella peptonophila]|uniref:Cell wall-associated hydrolase, NlpC family n=1 Tax=Seinonella peptonophila TaxID=112248 RepID=A0A1M4SKY6_9BACL|nr:NlpC/P60 family protein [Seinonella peptonophila]SHE32870.1 Cell wall-associated hydrolase, NlpC family [Seinonella peptonophila]
MRRSSFFILTLLLTLTLVSPISVFADPIEINPVDPSPDSQTIHSSDAGTYIIVDVTPPVTVIEPEATNDKPTDKVKDKPKKDDQQPKKDEEKNNNGKDSAISQTKIESMIKTAKSLVGPVPKDGNRWDCSGFVLQMYKKLGISLPGITDTQYYDRLVLSDEKYKKLPAGAKKLALNESEFKKLKPGSVYAKPVARDKLQPGDLFFRGPTYSCSSCYIDKNITHAALYVGHGKYVQGSMGSGMLRMGDVSNLDQWQGAKRYYIKN